MKYITSIILLIICYSSLFSQRSFEYKSSTSGLIATEKTLPMWATANKYGIIPNSRGGLLQAGVFSDFNPQKKIQVAYGISGAGYTTQAENKIILDEFYLSLKWLKIRLDLGMIHPEEEYNGVSAQNGNFMFSGNSRSMPGYNLHTEYISVPFTDNVLAFKFNLSDYTMLDDRFVDQTRVHYKSLYFKISPWKRLELIGGLDHSAQWAGNSPIYGKQPSSFDGYIKVFFGRSGGAGSTISDSVNVLGNHLGNRRFRINYKANNFTLSLYYDNFFEDGKIDNMTSIPDGTYGLYYAAKNKKQLISDIIYEFTYTKYQSGSRHDRPATEEEIKKQDRDTNDFYYGKVVLGGCDNNFNNGEYRSGWTYYGRSIGTPFITTSAPNAEGITLGTFNNRVIAHYLGIKGYFIKKVPYKLRLSYSLNYGTYGTSLEGTPEQFSFGLEAGILRKPKAPFHIDLGIYGDCGKLFDNTFGLSLSFSRNGLIK